MGLFTYKTYLLLIISLFFIACNEKELKAINPSEKLSFKYQDKRLELGSKEAFLLFFFSKNCGFCKEQIKILNQIKSIKKIAIINDAKDIKEAKELIKLKKLGFSLIFDKPSVSFLSQAVGGVSAVPVIYLYDKSGNKIYKYLGLTPLGLLIKSIKSL